MLREMPKRRFRVTMLPDEAAEPDAVPPFFETATKEEWIRAFRQWAEGHPSDAPPLSDEAVGRDSIYEGRG